MSDRDAVLEANAAFYAAFQSLDLKRMEEIWLRAPYIKCVHPGWGLLVHHHGSPIFGPVAAAEQMH